MFSNRASPKECSSNVPTNGAKDIDFSNVLEVPEKWPCALSPELYRDVEVLTKNRYNKASGPKLVDDIPTVVVMVGDMNIKAASSHDVRTHGHASRSTIQRAELTGHSQASLHSLRQSYDFEREQPTRSVKFVTTLLKNYIHFDAGRSRPRNEEMRGKYKGKQRKEKSQSERSCEQKAHGGIVEQYGAPISKGMQRGERSRLKKR